MLILVNLSNLIGMGIMPLQYLPGENAESLGLTGREVFNINTPSQLVPGQKITVRVSF